MRLLIPILAMLMLFSCKQKSTSTASAAKGYTIPDSLINKRGVFFNRNVVDMGVLQRGIPVMSKVIMFNHSNNQLQLEEPSTTCGCTTAKTSKKVVEPGDTCMVYISYDSKIPGIFSKDVYINFPGQLDVLRIEVKGHVEF
ncbi:MAG TPA: DUF1573 domain-containing protein [Saprospiraceae bacterium]|nr:DUF1573 domain-containing protein [Saprospiraceae bacterium]HQW57238.1 DUF1573 domain-containing protein [Saprospiraceae bacterium]